MATLCGAGDEDHHDGTPDTERNRDPEWREFAPLSQSVKLGQRYWW